MRSSWIRVAPNPMTGALLRGGTFGHRHPGRISGQGEGREWTPRAASSHRKLGQRHGSDAPLEPPEGTNLVNDIFISNFYLQNCDTINFYSRRHPVCGTLLWQPQETKPGDLVDLLAFITFCCNFGRDRVMGTRTAWPLNCRIQGCLLALSLGSWVTPGRACPQSEPPSPCLCKEDIKLDPCIQTLSPYLFTIFTTSPNHLYLFYLIFPLNQLQIDSCLENLALS